MRPLLWDIYEEHLSGASFLWTQWERALDSPIYSLEEIAAGFERRLMAHLDGLVLGGPEVAERLLVPVLKDEAAEPDVFWAAGWVALEERLEGGEDLVLKALSSEAPELREAATRVLELSARPGLEEKLRPLLDEAGPGAATALRVLSARGADVLAAAERLIDSEVPEVAAAAMRCLGPSPSAFARGVLERALQSSGSPLCDVAREAGLLARMRSAWESCLAAVKAGEASRVALHAVAVGGSDAQVEPLAAMLEDEAGRALGLEALGYSGRISAAEACLPWLGDPKVGTLAAEAFAAITGAPLKPLSSEEAPEDPDIEAGDEPPPAGPEEDLPRLDAEKASEWWKKQRPKVKAERLLAGDPWSAAAIGAALRGGPARRRHLLARELAVRTGSAPARTRAWAREQRAAPPTTARFDERGYGDLCR